MRISIIIPVFNERNTILELVKRVEALSLDKEIIIVDDYSKDGTREILNELNSGNIKVLFHKNNRGKGAAIRTALQFVTGDAVVIQDADLEVNPQEIPSLLKPIVDGKAEVVFGSRFKGRGEFRFITYFANRFLTGLTNFLYNIHISDMETCYKCIKTKLIKSIELKSNGFDFEPEITAKVSKRGYRIFEVPISYRMRTSAQGKKIKWRDALEAIYFLIKYRFKE